MDWIKDKIAEVTLTAALGLAALQIITPMFVDLVFDGLIIGLMWIGTKSSK
jgi:hypothetical protein